MARFAQIEITLRRREEAGYPVEMNYVPIDGDSDRRVPAEGAAYAAIDPDELRGLRPLEYGKTLGKWLFANQEFLAVFAEARGSLQSHRDDDPALRVRLTIHRDAQELDALHWETLCDFRGDPLLTGTEVLLSRYLSTTNPDPPSGRSDLRALIAVANPPEDGEGSLFAPVDVSTELKRAEDGFANSGITYQTLASGQSDSLGPATLEHILDQLDDGFDILYLVCHGGLMRDGVARLCLEEGLVDAAKVVTAVRSKKQLRLVILASCESAGKQTAASPGTLSAFGPMLVKAGVPAVVAMQGRIKMTTAATFLAAFFKELARGGGQIDRAMGAAREAALRDDCTDYWMPVLFLRLRSGNLWTENALPSPARSTAPAARPRDRGAVTPYRGLAHFGLEDQGFFFGREALCKALVDHLRVAPGVAENRFLGLVGPSGSGKSSLARAGLLGAFQRGELPGSEEWPLAVLRPGADPLESLAVALAPATGAAKTPASIRSQVEEFARSDRTLHLTTHLALGKRPPEQRLVVLVDQFEEVFTQCPDETMRRAFLDNLMVAATEPGGQTIVVLTLRADHYGSCAAYPRLAAALSDHQMLVGPMQEDELRRAIEQPAILAGAEFEPGLSDSLLEEVRGQPGSLPLLQYTLWELWNRRSGRRLTHAAYQAIGKVRGALERRAEELYGNLRPVEQAIVRRIFLRLVQPVEGGHAVRRRVQLRDLLPVKGDAEPVESVIARLAGAEARLLTLEAGDGDTGESVDIAHEALITNWPRLQGWLNEDLEFQLWLKRLDVSQEEWERTDRHPDSLLRGAVLQEAERWIETRATDLNRGESEFIEASANVEKLRLDQELAQQTELAEQQQARLKAETERAEVQTRSARRFRGFAFLLAVLALVAVAAAGYAFVQRAAAEREAAHATSLVLASASRDMPSADLQVLIAMHALARQDTPEAEAALYAAMEALRGPRFRPNADYTVLQLEFSPDGKLLATADDDGYVSLWNSETGFRARNRLPIAGGVESLVFRPDGTLAVATSSGLVRLIDTSGNPLGEVSVSAKGLRSLAINADGSRLATGSQDGAVALWTLPGEQRLALEGHTLAVLSMAFTPPKGEYLLSTSADGTAIAWEAATGRRLFQSGELKGDSMTAVAVNPTGEFAAMADLGGAIHFREIPSGKALGDRPADGRGIWALAFRPGGGLLVSSDQDSMVRFGDISSSGGYHERLAIPCGDGTAECRALTFLPDGHTLALAGARGGVWLVDTNLRKLFDQARASLDLRQIDQDACHAVIEPVTGQECEVPADFVPVN